MRIPGGLASLAGRTLRRCSGQAASAPTFIRLLSGGGLLLIGRDEGVGYERFVTGWRSVLGCARFKGTHVPGVQCGRHLQ